MRYNPFNPQQPARPDFFVGRTEEIKRFEEFLSQTLHNSPMNMSITGNRGIGKTSILAKLEQIAKEQNCLTLRISNYESNIKSITEFVDYIIINLKRELIAEQPAIAGQINRISDWVKTLKPILTYKDISLTVEKKIVVEKLFYDQLKKVWDCVKENHPTIVILIDEAESLEQIKGLFAFMREVFQRLSTDTNYTVVLCGKLNFKERMAESFSPLNRFFPTTDLLPFKDNEVREYINRKLSSVKVKVSKEVLNEICRISEGHPYVVVLMCYILFKHLKEKEMEINKELFDRILPVIKNQLAQDFFISLYHPLTPKARKVLLQIAKKLKKLDFTYKDAISFCNLKGNQVSPYIQELWRKGCINKPRRGYYVIFHTLFLDFLKEKITEKQEKEQSKLEF